MAKTTPTTNKPFGEAVQKLLDEKDWSLRELHRRTQDESGWGSLSTLHYLIRGDDSEVIVPTAEAIEKIASALRVPAGYFAEYRLAKRREELDPGRVGLRRALKNLER